MKTIIRQDVGADRFIHDCRLHGWIIKDIYKFHDDNGFVRGEVVCEKCQKKWIFKKEVK